MPAPPMPPLPTTHTPLRPRRGDAGDLLVRDGHDLRATLALAVLEENRRRAGERLDMAGLGVWMYG